MKALKEDIILWNRSEFRNVERLKKELLEALKLLDVKEGKHSLSEVELGEGCVEISNTKPSLIGRSLVETEIENALHYERR